MEKMNLAEIVAAVDGSFGYPANAEISNISTDTRTISQGSVFVAIKGEKNDGHNYARKAMELGAEAVITDHIVEGAKCIVVDSTRKALLDLASYYRSRFDIPVVGVTGSVGKTTTKDMIACVLSEKFNTMKTQGNHNNDIGVPWTLFTLSKENTAAVVEMGMSHAGEISRLSLCSKPTMAVITNIGVSHIENL
ncbi:MAG: UDP-N-acetylmuramoyl-tripeptide--D-alanyl-D-alanine ligase, partial [Oscillospiraceae bacterium]